MSTPMMGMAQGHLVAKALHPSYEAIDEERSKKSF
jgi:hypothetical protein